MPPDTNLPPEPSTLSTPPPPPAQLHPLNPVMQQFMRVALSSVGTLVRRLAVLAVGVAVSKQWVSGEWSDILITLLVAAMLAGLEWLIFNVRGRGAATLQDTINHYVGAPVLDRDKWVDYNTVTEVQKLLPPK